MIPGATSEGDHGIDVEGDTAEEAREAEREAERRVERRVIGESEVREAEATSGRETPTATATRRPSGRSDGRNPVGRHETQVVTVAGADGPGVNASTLVLAFGAVLFVLPVPGTFVAGTLVLLAGGAARVLGS